jgi:hypothetical protein
LKFGLILSKSPAGAAGKWATHHLPQACAEKGWRWRPVFFFDGQLSSMHLNRLQENNSLNMPNASIIFV